MNTKPTVHISSQSFTTESNFTFARPEFAYHSWGTLNAAKDNVVVIFHALTGNSDAKDWFSGFFEPGSAINLKRQYVICINQLGSCYGSTGPWSINPETGKAYQADFPLITIRDMARFQQQFLNELGITGIELIIGGSMGGMVALEFALMDNRVENVCLLAMGKAHSPWAIGISHAQRLAIYGDSKWNNGWYAKEEPPIHGLKAARSLAMITYRTADNYQKRFERNVNSNKNIFEVESYLEYQGNKLVDRFDALSYVRLSQAMDTHDVFRDRESFQNVLSNLSISALVVGIDSDLLYPTKEQKELAQLIPRATYAEIQSEYGHDAFLIEFEQLNQVITSFFTKSDLTKTA